MKFKEQVIIDISQDDSGEEKKEKKERRRREEKRMKRRRVPRGRVKWGNFHVLRVLSYVVHIIRSINNNLHNFYCVYMERRNNLGTYFRGSWHSSDVL